MHMKRRDRSTRERGQIIVLFALLVPVIFGLGTVVMSVGNWYVLKRHLQTQVDAAALAGGPAFTGCFQDPSGTNSKIRQQALEYAGDTLRDPTPATTYNLQLEQAGDQRVVINSNNYWSSGATDGTGYDFTLDSADPEDIDGSPCDEAYLDVKVTDDQAPLLFRWLPFFPSPKARARVDISQVVSTNGIRPLAVPEFEPQTVAVLFVDEDGVASSAGSVRGAAFLAHDPTPPTGLEGMAIWSKDAIAPVGINGNDNFGVIVLSSLDPQSSVSLAGNIGQICGQNPARTRCYGGGTLSSGISFIHAYSTSGGGSANNPLVRDVTLGGGCTEDLSRPYFNLTGGCPIGITATIDFGTGSTDPRLPVASGGVCAEVTVPTSSGASLTWSGGVWSGGAFSPRDSENGGGPHQVDLRTVTDTTGSCAGGNNPSDTFSRVGKPFVANGNSDVVQYLVVEKSSGGLANSMAKDSAASLDVVVGLTPPLRDRPLNAPPLPLRIGEMPNTMALRCDGAPNNGKPGWEEMMRRGCASHQIYDESKHPGGECSPRITPDDCVDSKPGNFSQTVPRELWGQPSTPACTDTPNNWNGVTLPDPRDPRWMPLFIVDPEAGNAPPDKTFPIRRFGMFYVTAASDLNCTGDNPPGNLGPKRQIWGHFASYITPGFGETVPSGVKCSFTEGGLCVSNLVE
jgi:hypothetical protein